MNTNSHEVNLNCLLNSQYIDVLIKKFKGLCHNSSYKLHHFNNPKHKSRYISTIKGQLIFKIY